MIKISIKRLSVWVNSFLIGTVNIFQLIWLLPQDQFIVLFIQLSQVVLNKEHYNVSAGYLRNISHFFIDFLGSQSKFLSSI